MVTKFVMACFVAAMLTQLADAGPSTTPAQVERTFMAPSPTPAEIETSFMAAIQISDPLAFDLDRYVVAVKKTAGVAQLPKAVVEGFEIIVKYVLPDGMPISEARAAIVKANNVFDHQVKVTQNTIPSIYNSWGRLNIIDVTIIVPDKSKAAAVQTSAANVAALEREMDGHASIVKAPPSYDKPFIVTTAKVETKVKSAVSSPVRLTHIDFDGSDVGGMVEAWWQPLPGERTTTTTPISGASSNVRIVLVALLVLLWVI